MQETMKAVVYHGPNKISLDDVPVPKLMYPDDAIVKVTTSTICGTDIHIQHGGLPAVESGRVIGHEFVGEVVDTGSAVSKAKVGDKVAVSCITQCGRCFYCRQQMYSQCESGSWIFGYLIDGSQAEYVRVPHANMGMHLIPDGLTEEDILFVGDILSTGYFGAENGDIQPGDVVTVMGSGPVGMCAMMCARLFSPSKIIAVDMDQSRLDIALKQGIADIAINPAQEHPIEKIKLLSKGRGADVAIEAVGVTGTYKLALDAVRPGGTVSILGVYEQPQELPMNELWIKNINIRMGLVNANRIPQLIKLISTEKLSTHFLITHRSPLNDVLKGYDTFGNKKDNCLKWVLTPFER